MHPKKLMDFIFMRLSENEDLNEKIQGMVINLLALPFNTLCNRVREVRKERLHWESVMTPSLFHHSVET